MELERNETAAEVTLKMRSERVRCYCRQQIDFMVITEIENGILNLTRNEPSVFCRSQWQSGKRSIVWLSYRWFVALFFIGGVTGSILHEHKRGHWYIFLTDWSTLLCTFTFTLGAIIATLYYFNQQYFGKRSHKNLLLKIYWIAHWTTLVLATLITFVFWCFLLPMTKHIRVDLYIFWTHACSLIFMILDQMLVAFPSRLTHSIYPIVVSIAYSTFTLIYHAVGGAKPVGQYYTYPIYEWPTPIVAIGYVIGCVVFVSLICFMHFWFYRLRVHLHNKYKAPFDPGEEIEEKRVKFNKRLNIVYY